MIDSSIKEEIVNRFKMTEKKYNVNILMAIESGSRAWGFASPNSDYDVRFIYVNRADWYLAVDLEDKRDVIEYPIVDDIDLNGWDVRKALKLFWKSNPAFIEWIQSPISYIDDRSFRDECLNLLPEIYSVEKGIYHYRSMAKTNYRGYLREDRVPLKKYFYVLRPLFSIQWLEKYGVAVPKGIPAMSVDEAVKAAEELQKGGATLLVVKAQIHAGGRGKGKFKELPEDAKGGVRLAFSLDEVKAHASEMLGNTLVTKQTGAAGKQVKEEGLPNDMVDRVAADPAFGLTKEEIVAGLVPENFVGRAPQQVE